MQFKEEVFYFNFPYKIGSRLITEKKIISIIKNNKIISEITTLEGLHKEDIYESLNDFKEKKYHLPSSKFSRSIYNYFKHNSVPKEIKTAYLWPIDFDANDREEIIIKIKVGRNDTKQDQQTISNILASHKKLKLRIDGNKKCTSKKMLEIINGIPADKIDYIEDSFINVKEEYDFFLETKLKIAMDEGIRNYFINKNWQEFPKHIKHVVIKPSLIGGLEDLRYITKKLDQKNITYNLSSTFEGHLGLKFIYALSKRKVFKNMMTPGIDTLRFLTKKEGL